jgi:hypothetical protein
VYVTPTVAELEARRSYQCTCCSRYCANPQALKKHLKSHGEDGVAALAALEAGESNGIAGETGEGGTAADGRPKYYYCPAEGCAHNSATCAEANPFKTLRNLRDHYQTAHSVAAVDCACAKCGKPFKVKSRMQSHQKHCGDVYRCSCGCDFRERRSLMHHIKLFPLHHETGRVNTAGQLVAGPGGAGLDGEGDDEDAGIEAAPHGGEAAGL